MRVVPLHNFYYASEITQGKLRQCVSNKTGLSIYIKELRWSIIVGTKVYQLAYKYHKYIDLIKL